MQIADGNHNRKYSRTPSPTKSRLNFLENFKSVLGRSKTKPDGFEEVFINGIRIGENGHGSGLSGGDNKAGTRRWSESHHGNPVSYESEGSL